MTNAINTARLSNPVKKPMIRKVRDNKREIRNVKMN